MKKRIIFLCLLTMVLIAVIFMPNNYHVQAEQPFTEDDIEHQNSVTINDIKRTLYVLKNADAYFQIGNEKPFLLGRKNKKHVWTDLQLFGLLIMCESFLHGITIYVRNPHSTVYQIQLVKIHMLVKGKTLRAMTMIMQLDLS